MKKTISVIAFHRPEYLTQCLEALSKARGLEEWEVTVSVDGPPDEWTRECFHMADRFNDKVGERVSVSCTQRCGNLGIHDLHPGRPDHPFTVIQEAFDGGSELHLYLEEDCLVASDALEWVSTLRPMLLPWDEHWFMNLADHTWDGENNITGVHRRPGISSPWAWALTPDAWSHIRRIWNRKTDPPTGFDWSLNYDMNALGVWSIAPNLARAINIGREGGVHGDPEFFDTYLARMPWSGGPR